MSTATVAGTRRPGRGRPPHKGSLRRTGSRARTRWWLPLAVVAALLLLAQMLTATGAIPARFLPPPTQIGAALGGMVAGSALWVDLSQTLLGWAVALAIAVVLGTLAGVLLSRFAVVQALVTPVLEFLRPIPSIALIPLVILTIGGGTQGEVFLAAYAALWQMLVAALYAAGNVDPVARETARIFQLGHRDTFRWVTLPSMLPGLFTGIRIASATALIIVITSEILIGSPGLGRGLNLARSGAALDRMYAYLAVIGLVGFALNSGLRQLERRLLGWQPGGSQGAR